MYRFAVVENIIKNTLKLFKRRTSASTKIKLLKEITKPIIRVEDKVTIIGAGNVGISTAFLLLSRNVTSNLVLVDNDKKRLDGEVLDLQQCSIYMGNCKVEACTDYSETVNSKIAIFTAGIPGKPNESRLNLLQKNVDVLKQTLPKLVRYSPDVILLMVSNPVDVLSYAAWKISGLASIKVIGSGTNLDSSRFRFLLSQRLGVDTESCYGFIVGEHGDSSVPLWSSVNIAGIRLRDVNPAAGTDKDTENWSKIHEQVVKSAYNVIALKGSTCWAIGMSITAIVKDMLWNPVNAHAVSVNARGFYGIENDVYFSLPCLLDKRGLSQIVKVKLDDVEKEKLRKSAELLTKAQNSVKI